MEKFLFSPHKTRGKSPTPSIVRKAGKSKTTIVSKSQFNFISLLHIEFLFEKCNLLI